jgi:hypothetical protein
VRTTDTLVTECIKPPKKKKKKKGDNGSGDADFRADGTGGKSGKGKGSGKGGGGSSSSSESWSAASSSSSTTSSTNMIPVESPSSSGSSSGSSTSTSTITFNFNTARGKGGKGNKGKKGKGDDYNGDEYYNGDSGSSSVRFCEEDEYDDGDESDNVSDGGGTGVVAPGPGPMPAPPSATPQEGDNQATSPFASPPTEGMLPPTQPDSSVVGGGGGDSGESGGPSSGEEAVDDTPTISPNTFPVMAPSSSNSSSSVVGDGTGSNNTNVTFMGQESICAAFAAGRSPTLGPRQGHVVRLALNVRNETQIGQLQSIYRQMDAILQQRIAPLLLNCVDQRRRTKSGMRHGRRAQITTERSNRTEYVNAVFGNTTREPQSTYMCSIVCLTSCMSPWR